MSIQKPHYKIWLWVLVITGICAVFIGFLLRPHIASKNDVCGKQIVFPGEYRLEGDCTASKRQVVSIITGHVKLDLNGYTLRCDPNIKNSIGIYATSSSRLPMNSGLTIRHGKITGCYMGLNIPQMDNVIVENVDFSGNLYIGATLGGDGNVIRLNTFKNIGGAPNEAYAIALNRPGSNCLIERNAFTDIYRGKVSEDIVGEGVGVLISNGNSGCIVRENRFNNTVYEAETYGLWLAGNTYTQAENNGYVNLQYSIVGTDSATADVKGNRIWLKHRERDTHGIFVRKGRVEDNLIVGPEYPIQGIGDPKENQIKN